MYGLIGKMLAKEGQRDALIALLLDCAVVAFFAILLLLENLHPRAGMADQSIS